MFRFPGLEDRGGASRVAAAAAAGAAAAAAVAHQPLLEHACACFRPFYSSREK